MNEIYYINNSVQFKIKTYLRLAELTDPSDRNRREKYICAVEDLLESKENNTSVAEKESVEEDYRIGFIGKYIAGKSRVCLYEIWKNAIPENEGKMQRRDSIELANILKDYFGWIAGKAEHFSEYGTQRAFHKPTQITTEELPFD